MLHEEKMIQMSELEKKQQKRESHRPMSFINIDENLKRLATESNCRKRHKKTKKGPGVPAPSRVFDIGVRVQGDTIGRKAVLGICGVAIPEMLTPDSRERSKLPSY